LPRDVGVLMVAAGRGERAGGGEPKQFRTIGGVPMLLRALRPFTSHPDVAQVVVALPPESVMSPPTWLAALASPSLLLVPGGESRSASVARALSALAASATVVLVHDAARPFVSRETIDSVIGTVRAGECAVAAIPVSDTLKQASPGLVVTGTVPREGLWRAQTPQGFPRAVLDRAHAAGMEPATDDATLVEALGQVVRIVPDTSANMKVTTPEDFLVAEAIAARDR